MRPWLGDARAQDEGVGLVTAALEAGDDNNGEEAPLPGVLSDTDAALYRRIFNVQERGDWKTADRLIKKLDDRLLLGHVLAQRYLHPTKYRSHYKELKAWLAKYADHPDAQRLYKLALRRKPRKWRAPRPPVRFRTLVAGSAPAAVAPPRRRLSRTARRKAAAYKRRIRWHLSKGWTKAVKKLLATHEVARLFSETDMDQAKARLGFRYFVEGRDRLALKWASEAAGRSGARLSEAHWTAGLAAWRLGRYALAHRHFEAIARVPDASPWLISAAAFWAARSHLLDREPQHVNRLLLEAAAYPRTFYGLLARRLLGQPNSFRWRVPPMEEKTLDALTADAVGRRALALVQVGQVRRAERELKNAAMAADEKLARGILIMALRAKMPSLALRLDRRLRLRGGYDGAAYPVPPWGPKRGFRVDRALIYALIRQESQFNPNAKSWAGARGLMQLMPRTASFVARDRRFRRRNRRMLFKPEVNLTLGQKYVEILLSEPKINGDLLLMAAAWNGGPGNLNKWRRRAKHGGDPLLFIESIPSKETRDFIERVLANFWIYRDRLGQDSPSLDAIAAGDWPVYTALDREPVSVAEHVED